MLTQGRGLNYTVLRVFSSAGIRKEDTANNSKTVPRNIFFAIKITDLKKFFIMKNCKIRYAVARFNELLIYKDLTKFTK